MVGQLDILAGNVIPTALHTEVQRSYLEYAMSVIVGRALPDVRDGLKPVHRRILYAMHELGLTPDRPFRKCARVVGDVLGKYHPHGDQAVYDALVRMVQDFSSRYPLLEGHGNFGSIDDDPPAAMRYTETRLAPVSNEGLLAEIGTATVDFIGNFDNSQQEPIVLPAQLPFLLLNGCSGIAVGMATNIPPHNLGELIDGLIALIDDPDLTDEKLLRLIPAPDFPTGGEIIDTPGIRDAYLTGRGSITIRGVARVEEVQVGKGRHRRTAIVVTELPFQVNKASWIEKIAELVNQGKLDGIIDIRDESDREGMRVVIELKREVQPAVVLDRLYKLTPLQNNFGVIMLALADNQPRQMPLREILQHFLNFREETLTRQYTHELEKAREEAHILEGLLDALDHLDDVIDILRHAPDGGSAKVTLQEELGLSDRQANALLAMPLRRLTGMERQKLQQEFENLNTRMGELERLLNNRKELLKSLKKDLRTLRKKYDNPRRTRLLSAKQHAEESAQLAEIVAEETAAEQEVVLEFTQKGYVRRLAPKAYERQQAKQESQATRKWVENSDFTTYADYVTTEDELLVLTRSGKAYTVKVGDIPPTTRQSKGTPVVGMLPASAQEDAEAIVEQLILTPGSEALDQLDLVMLTRQGKVKRTPLKEFVNLSGRGVMALKLKEGDELAFALLVEADFQLLLATSGGRILRLEINDEQLPLMSRSAQGLQLVRLGKQEEIIGCISLGTDDEMLLMTAQGYAKRMAVSAIRAISRGDLGVQGMAFATKADRLVGLVPAFPGDTIVVITDEDHLAYLSVDDVEVMDRNDGGDRPLKLSRKEKVTRLVTLALPSLGDETDESGNG